MLCRTTAMEAVSLSRKIYPSTMAVGYQGDEHRFPPYRKPYGKSKSFFLVIYANERHGSPVAFVCCPFIPLPRLIGPKYPLMES